MLKHLPNGPTCHDCIIGGCATTNRVPQALGFMRSDGAMRSGVAIIAEALGHHEALQNKALVGNAGFFMGRSFNRPRIEHWMEGGQPVQKRLGRWNRDEFAYYNALLCQPLGNTIRDGDGKLFWWAEEALSHCRPNLDQFIEQREPKAIVAFGDTAFHQLTGLTLGTSEARGYAFRDWKNRTWVIPTYHPARLIRGEQYLQPAFLWDVDKARWIAEHGYAYEDVECLADPPIEMWNAYVEALIHYILTAERPVVATDIETPYKRGKNEGDLVGKDDPTFTILDISFAFEAKRGATVAAKMPYLIGVQKIFEALRKRPEAICVIWNRDYDRPRIQHNFGGHLLPIRQTEDAMWAWHVLYNSLDRGIGFATSCMPLGQRGFRAWKHLGQDDPIYRVYDSVALWRNYQDILPLLEASGQTGVYDLMVRRLDPCLETAESHGLLVDREMRDRVSAELTEKLEGLSRAMTEAVPESLRPSQTWKTLKAAEKGLDLLKGRRETFPDATLIEIPGEKKVKKCSNCGSLGVKADHVKRRHLKAGHPVLQDHGGPLQGTLPAEHTDGSPQTGV